MVTIGLPAAGNADAAFDNAVSVACAVNSWLPSMSTEGAPPVLVRTATAACPSRSWSSAQDLAACESLLTTSNGFGSARATVAAPGPATATGIDGTSKLAA